MGGIEFLSSCECWALRFEIENDRQRGIEWGFRYRLTGLGDDEDPRRPFSGRRRRYVDSSDSL
jgi:hypothetical protein